MHKNAFKAAEAVSCAGDQEKFWEMHDRLFAAQNDLAVESLMKHAGGIGLETSKFKACLEEGKYAGRIRQDINDAKKVGLTGTPAFLIGFTEPGGKVRAVKMIKGAQPYAAFKQAIDSLLPQQKE